MRPSPSPSPSLSLSLSLSLSRLRIPWPLHHSSSNRISTKTFLGGEKPGNTAFLIATQPRLDGLPKQPIANEIHKLPDNDTHKGDRIHPMDMFMQDLDADTHTPKVHGEHGDAEGGGRREAEHERREAVEEGQAESVSGQVAADFTVPVGAMEGRAVEDGGLHAVDEEAPKGHLANDLVDGPGADEEFLDRVARPVEGGADQGEDVALDLFAGGDAPAVAAGDVVRGDEHAHAADGDQDPRDLREMVADVQEDEGEDHDDGDAPEIDQLGAEHGGVFVGEDGEVVPFHVAEGEDEVLPSVVQDQPEPAPEAIAVESVRGEDQRE